MPVGSVCRSCGASLSGDVAWCARCLAPVKTFARRPPLHDPGTYVGRPEPEARTSRWQAGPTTFGPAGRIVSTLVVAAMFPWWGLGGFNPFFLWALMGWLLAGGVFLRSIWRPAPVGPREPTAGDRLRARHPLLARRIRISHGARGTMLVFAVGGAVAAWLALDDTARYLWAVVAIMSGVGVALARWNEL
jgi:hypothetical protein